MNRLLIVIPAYNEEESIEEVVNNIKENQQTEITEYLNNFIDKMKTTEKLDNWSLLKTSLAQNLILGISIWFFRNYCNRNTNSIWNCII